MIQRLVPLAATLGLLGSLACSGAMVMALAGVLGAGLAASAAASAGDMGGMPGMSSTPPPVPHDSSVPTPLMTAVLFLVQAGPVILILSIAAVALAVGMRRRRALMPVVLGGLVLYWGMYLQGAKAVMYSSVVLGLAALFAAYRWSIRTIQGA